MEESLHTLIPDGLGEAHKSRASVENPVVVLPADVYFKFERTTIRLFHAVTLLSVTAFALMVLGGTVRNMGAGLSCPDWPMCFGKIIPPMNPQVFAEWFHRVIASVVSVGLLGISVLIFKNPFYRQKLGRLNLSALTLLFAQVILGGLTVIGLLKSEIVTFHLAVGFLFFGTLVWMSLKTRSLVFSSQESANALKLDADGKRLALLKFSRFAFVTAGVVYVQVLLGGTVSSNYAGLACLDFPTCNGSLVPHLTGNVALQFFHRVGALLVFVKVCALAAKSRRTPLTPGLRRMMGVVVALLLTQITLGISSVFLKIPPMLSVAHLGVAAALFAALLVVSYESGHLRLY